MKYVIKNCECKVKGKTTLCVRDIPYKKCENITDCLLKRIVENLKICLQDNTCDNCDGVGYYDGCQDIKCADYQARKCLELLQIEEV